MHTWEPWGKELREQSEVDAYTLFSGQSGMGGCYRPARSGRFFTRPTKWEVEAREQGVYFCAWLQGDTVQVPSTVSKSTTFSLLMDMRWPPCANHSSLQSVNRFPQSKYPDSFKYSFLVSHLTIPQTDLPTTQQWVRLFSVVISRWLPSCWPASGTNASHVQRRVRNSLQELDGTAQLWKGEGQRGKLHKDKDYLC